MHSQLWHWSKLNYDNCIFAKEHNWAVVQEQPEVELCRRLFAEYQVPQLAVASESAELVTVRRPS